MIGERVVHGKLLTDRRCGRVVMEVLDCPVHCSNPVIGKIWYGEDDNRVEYLCQEHYMAVMAAQTRKINGFKEEGNS